MEEKIPIPYAYILQKIGEKTKSRYIHVNLLKEVILRTIWGKIPSWYLWDIIKEMEDYNLIKKINYPFFEPTEAHLKKDKTTCPSCGNKIKEEIYLILKNKAEKKLRKFLWGFF